MHPHSAGKILGTEVFERMITGKELLNQGKLHAAIEQVTLEVKARPADTAARIFLFEMLCMSGDFDRAEKQLDVISHQSTEMQMGAVVYKQALAAERARSGVHKEGRTPTFLKSPPEYAALHLEALSCARSSEPGKARVLLEKALSLAPPLAGRIDGTAFEEFGDSDVFLGPFLELIVNDNYAWLPFEEIQRIEISKPENLRDLLWARAKVTARGGDLGHVFLPVLYPRSGEDGSEAIRLGRATEWRDLGEGLQRGAGQRLFLIDGEERAMLEICEIEFNEPSQVVTS